MRDRERAAKILAKADSLPGARSKVEQLVAAEGKWPFGQSDAGEHGSAKMLN